MEVIHTQKPLENKPTFPTSASSNGMAGVILEITRPLSLIIKKYSVVSLALLENELAQWVLKSNGNVVPRQTVWPLQLTELHSDMENGNELFLMHSLRGDGDHQ